MRRTLSVLALCLGICACLTTPTQRSRARVTGRLVLHGEITLDSASQACSLAVHAQRARIACLDPTGGVTLFDLRNPELPTLSGRFSVNVGPHEEATSIAFHPTRDWLFFTIRKRHGVGNGRLELWDLDSNARLAAVETGPSPVRVAVDPTGTWTVALNSAELLEFNTNDRTFIAREPSVTLLHLATAFPAMQPQELELPSIEEETGFVSSEDERWIQAAVDWNANNQYDATLDFDGDAVVEDEPVRVGTFEGESIYARESDGELFRLPLRSDKPTLLRPSRMAFSSDGTLAYLSLRENNGVLVLNLKEGAFVRAFGLGLTTHAADISDDSEIRIEGPVTALREPCDIALSADGRTFLTANRGGTLPTVGETPADLPKGGGRGFSLFDARTGQLLDDTGSSLEFHLVAAGMYRDSLSPVRGAAPSALAAFDALGTTVAVAVLPDVDALCLLAVKHGTQLELLQVQPIRPTHEPVHYPHQIAHFSPAGSRRHYLYVVHQNVNTLSVFEAQIR